MTEVVGVVAVAGEGSGGSFDGGTLLGDTLLGGG